jgi:hypothetical protein
MGLMISCLWASCFLSRYEVIARHLTEWENHRTPTEFEDSIISKNFMFQFINNCEFDWESCSERAWSIQLSVSHTNLTCWCGV